MKNKYFIKTTGIVLTLGLLLLFGGLQAQNRSFLNFDGDDSFFVNDASNKLDVNGSDWTIELWVFPTSTPASGTFPVIASRKYSFELYFRNNGSDLLGVGIIALDGSGQGFGIEGTLTSGSNYMTLNHWHHIAVSSTKPGSTRTTRLFIDGTQVGSSTDADFDLDASIAAINFGARYDGSYKRYVQNCDFDEIRYSKTARYTAAFTPTIYDNQFIADANTILLYHLNEGTGTNINCDGDSDFNTSLRSSPHDAGWFSWISHSSDHLPLAYEWTGGTDTDWGNTGNWDGGTLPGSTKDVLIPNVANDPVIGTSTTADCNNLLLESGATLEISSSSSGTGSLIIAGDLTNNGTITVNRYMTAYTDDDDGWHFLSAPVSNFTISGSDFDPTRNSDVDDLYEYDETASSENWLNYDGGTFGDTKFVVGKGYLCAYENAATKQFTGDINTGSHTKNLSYTGTVSSPGWNLLGNPYTAAIDWDDITKTASVDGSVYVLRASDGSYISWNGTTGGLTGGIIPAMQGFFVKANATNQSITMDPEDETHATGTYYKNAASLAENTIKINVSGASGESNEYIQFREDATVQFDHTCDAYKLFGFSNAPQIYTNDGEELYSINCLPVSMKNYDLSMGIKIVDEGNYTLSFEGIDNISDKFEIDLEDIQTGTTETVTPGFSYTFSYKEGDNPDRFVLHFYNVTATPEIGSENSTMIYAYQNSIVVKSFEKPLNGNIEIINLLGQTVYKQQVTGTGFVSLRPQLENGAYIVRYRGNDGTVQSDKVILQ